jgi:hypothetical protein
VPPQGAFERGADLYLSLACPHSGQDLGKGLLRQLRRSSDSGNLLRRLYRSEALHQVIRR